MFKNLKKTIIPKRIFYVWFGEKKSNLANICIENWKDKLKNFEIIEINENSPYFNFQKEYENCLWFRLVYDKKLWALASDYVRCKVLYDYGGIYLDTDITFKKDITPLLNDKFFIGEEQSERLGVGIFGCVKNHLFLKQIIDFYKNDIFSSPLCIIPEIFTDFKENYKGNDLKVYPKEYFYPYYFNENFTPECIKENTYTIHWWNASWFDKKYMEFLETKKNLF